MYCNNSAHIAINCNCDMQCRRKILTDIGQNFMLEDTLPDFNSFPINELRFIASIYEDFQKSQDKHHMKHQLKYHTCEYFDSEIMVEYLLSPIPVTITKSRILKEFKLRWTMYAPVRLNKNHKKPENEVCPICWDCLYIPRWNPSNLDWDMVTPKLYSPDASDDGNVKALCGHILCGCCWEKHTQANGYTNYEYYRNQLTTPLTETKWIRMVVNCPLCRKKTPYKKKLNK